MSLLPLNFPGSWRQHPAGYQYFLPASLPISEPLPLSGAIIKQVQNASLVLGEFSSLIERIPNPDLFIHAYTRKEAMLSSRIEGTQSTLEDAFKLEVDIDPEQRDDWAEVNAYIQAMRQAVEQLQNLPLCNRVISETHQRLLSQVRGKNKQPGAFRASQNWIGGSRPDNAHFVPPAPEYVAELMGDLERFIHNKQSMYPELIDAALIHCQFESIHPFLDGNGRLGRMLISLYLLEKRILKHPILYISTFLEAKRKDYYQMLDGARINVDGVVKWVSFFLDAVEATAKDGICVTQKLLQYDESLKQNDLPTLGARAKKGLVLLEYLYHRPYINAKQLQQDLKFSAQVSQKLIKDFVELGILKETTGKRRNRFFLFHHYINLLEGSTSA